MLRLGQNYDLLCNMIIRPPRFVYDIADLGPKFFAAGGKSAQRTDFELVNGRGMIIHCSHFQPISNWEKPMPCVIYLHGNGGCRLEALDVVHTLLPAEISVIALDFAGSGLSEGEYVSLGYWEQHDVAAVVKYLRETNRCSTIGLWGRSMGAVTAILYSMQDPSIASMVLDSPFCSLQKIAEDLVMNIETLQKMPRFTKFAVGLAMKPIRSTIKKKAKFDIKALEILDLITNCFIPALFVHGKDDNFVLPIHSEVLYSKYNGDKNRVLVEGNHNSIRPDFFMDSAVIFFSNTLYNGVAPLRNGNEQSPLPDLPLSAPQTQAQVQLQQFHDILHLNNQSQQQHHHNHLAQESSQPMHSVDLHARDDLVLNDIGVHISSRHESFDSAVNNLHGSVVIDGIVIGNSVVIDGKEVILDNDNESDAYYSPHESSTPIDSSTPLNTSFTSTTLDTMTERDTNRAESPASLPANTTLPSLSNEPTSSNYLLTPSQSHEQPSQMTDTETIIIHPTQVHETQLSHQPSADFSATDPQPTDDTPTDDTPTDDTPTDDTPTGDTPAATFTSTNSLAPNDTHPVEQVSVDES